MPIPHWPDTLLPSRATRRRIRLRKDFENSMLASELDDEDVPALPIPVPAAGPSYAAPAVLPDQPFQHDLPMRPLPLPPPPAMPRAPSGFSRPELWPEPQTEDKPGTLARLARIVGVGSAVLVCALVLTKGLAEMVWEFVGR